MYRVQIRIQDRYLDYVSCARGRMRRRSEKMAARVIHFGVDACYRLSVLRRAGYDIENCRNLDELCDALQSEGETDAVMVNDSDGSMSPQAIFLVRTRTTAPIIVFPSSIQAYLVEDVDLLVPAFTPPEEWLLDLANLIVHTRVLRAHSRSLREESQSLRHESLAIRLKSRLARERALRMIKVKIQSPFNPDGDSK